MIGRKVKLSGITNTYTVVDKIKIHESYDHVVDGYILMDENGLLFYEKYTMLERVVEEESKYVPCGVVHPAAIVTKEDFKSYIDGGRVTPSEPEPTNKEPENCGPPMPKKYYVEGEGGYIPPCKPPTSNMVYSYFPEDFNH